ncbi:MAG: thioredoxin [Candidatus Thermoplasmatota archaeon]|nr:thioredoxin [Euryarchaeota archaeon]MBU4071021.1 thioredoxin [Candidatus Thermoplasmatota archaeon]MBU4144878.1 thioredoxin [Candidatus Thermoplasmatota archaeon]MBU4592659.1 thioredoxin [Candidatus Thermoplasmatota archaeon]
MIDDGFDEELKSIRKQKIEKLKSNQNKMEEKNMNADKNWPSTPVNVSDSDFQDFINKYPLVIIDCWAPWCGPCRILGPVIDELAGAYAGKIAFGKLNTDECQATAMSFGIQSIPTMLFFKDGKLASREVGAMPRSMLEPKVKAFMQ